jgi:hypothetical protein
METAREHTFTAWRDLDVLVAAEFDALEAHRPLGAARRHDPDEAAAFEARDEADEGFDGLEAEPDDEEAFIERTAGWLRGRGDAEALLEAVRSALAERADEPTARMSQAPEEPPLEAPAAAPEPQPPAEPPSDAA